MGGYFDGVIRKGLSEEVTIKLRPEGCEGVSHWEGPESRACQCKKPVCVRVLRQEELGMLEVLELEWFGWSIVSEGRRA